MYMFFYKRDVTMMLYFLSFLINIITANSDEEAGPSGTKTPAEDSKRNNSVFIVNASESDYEAGPSGPSSPFEESEETISADSDCWKNMQYYCKQEIPNSVDFAKAAIAESLMGDLFHKPHLEEYYISLLTFLRPGRILPPHAYCRMFERKKTTNNENRKTKCRIQLIRFGITNDEALRYAFYQTKLNKIDSSPLLNISLMFAKEKDFRSDYIKHIIQHVEVDDKMTDPSQFCIEYDKQIRIRKNYQKN